MIPAPQRVQAVERVVGMMESEVFVGPLPHPKHLAEYERCSAGLATRIVAMAELAQGRIEDRKDLIVENEFQDRRLGMWLGFFALCALLTCGTILTVTGNTAVGVTLFGAAVFGTVIGGFIHGRTPKRSTKSGGDNPVPNTTTRSSSKAQVAASRPVKT